ncbi:MAG: toll/interleukin-1 receptor domain-containing protein [Desulfobulbaceae bacterium]|nr:toll/interleukin-1 receptor domain-containing protein [Desulfobulbaceae bacterium]
MKIFISWSGESSRAIATYIARWLRMLPFSTMETWMSGDAIDPGSRWSMELAQALESTEFGILCLTRENQIEPWISFEAGALSKAVEKAKVIPYLIGFSPEELKHPLRQFQAVPANREGTSKLVQSLFSLDSNCGRTQEDVRCSFEALWPDLEKEILAAVGSKIPEKKALGGQDDATHRLTHIEKMLESLSGRLLAWESRQSEHMAPKRSSLNRSRHLYVYTGGYTPSVQQQLLIYEYDDIEDFFALRNKVYFDTGGINPTHTYGHTWVLIDPKTRTPFMNTRMLTQGIPGKHYEDTRTLEEVGILPGMTLEMVKPEQTGQT